jgi:DNA-binding NtrC family response regulator
MSSGPRDTSRPLGVVPDALSAVALLNELERLYRTGENATVLQHWREASSGQLDLETRARGLTISGMASYDLGDVVESIRALEEAQDLSKSLPLSLQFVTAFALLVRKADFLPAEEVLSGLTHLRQLASSVGNARSLASLHLAVARLEGLCGHYINAHRHLEVARRLIEPYDDVPLRCAVDNVEASLESLGGNLSRARSLAESCLDRGRRAGFARYILGSSTNLAAISTAGGNFRQARQALEFVLSAELVASHIKIGALDCLAQLELAIDRTDDAAKALDACAVAVAKEALPARSWYDLAHQLTRCAYFERLENWRAVIDVVDAADPEVARRQFKAVRTSLLCARARALARLGRHPQAAASLATAVRICPRGAVDPLIVLEATKAVCHAARGDASAAALHADRAVAACRAIGHKQHEAWITRECDIAGRAQSRPARRGLDLTDTAMVMSDIAAMLGAGHSIDLLAHRIAAVLHQTPLASRVHVHSESGRDYLPAPTATWDVEADGSFRLRLRGSDRYVSIHVRGVETIDEISLLKSVADVVQAAVNRTSDTEQEDEDQNFWPRATVAGDDDALFQSPRMIELQKIALRLAATNLPVLITGETGTGKEVLARLIHEGSAVQRGPFVAFNCSSLPRELVESQLFGHRRGAFTGAFDSSPGVIRAAERGTLFLDEIGELELSVQPKFLRFLESGEIHPVGEPRPQRVNVRIVAATNANLEDLAAQGRFRHDLIYRIGVARVALPPLRERKDEIPALAALFLKRYARECHRQGLRLGDDLIAALILHDWPGNIRQLGNEIRRIVALAEDGDVLGPADLAPEIAKHWNVRPPAAAPGTAPGVEIRLDQPLARAMEDLERRFIEHAMAASGGRVADAAQLLGLSRKGLFLKRRRRGLVGDRMSDAG